MEQIDIILKVKVTLYNVTNSKIDNYHYGTIVADDVLLLPANTLVQYGDNLMVCHDNIHIQYILYDHETKLKKLKKDNCFIFNRDDKKYLCLIKQINIHSIDGVEL